MPFVSCPAADFGLHSLRFTAVVSSAIVRDERCYRKVKSKCQCRHDHRHRRRRLPRGGGRRGGAGQIVTSAVAARVGPRLNARLSAAAAPPPPCQSPSGAAAGRPPPTRRRRRPRHRRPPPPLPPPPAQYRRASHLACSQRSAAEHEQRAGEIYDTMALNTADPGDADPRARAGGISDISAVWGYHQLEQPKGGGDADPDVLPRGPPLRRASRTTHRRSRSSTALSASTAAAWRTSAARQLTCSCDTDMAALAARRR